VRYGAEKIFDGAQGSTITDEDIETIIAKGEDATKQVRLAFPKSRLPV